ncbi:glycoside hydrolase family 61 protein [Hypoxylon fragiforme]|uniref:glycoside hydrolase family 61 protein n=1 Tax=Hypoxylon fragiforme TaxID=63214 RepID=UPI0020C73F39|nr:glycoside hydrolase family 61 protein [Hypoxylon fragiforme]KAI2607392.1 glycoside hydrolase family 61 protein [Hypoxylon fragiforme]
MPVSVASVVTLLGAFVTTTLGHGYVTGFVTDGVQQQGFLLDYYYNKKNGMPSPKIAAWYAENTDSGFVAPGAYQTPDINCHKNSQPGEITVPIKAGGTVVFQWGTAAGGAWPHPYGPIIDYLAACDGDCSKADKTKLKWFKIQESGIDYGTQEWASAKLVANNNTWTTTIPKSIAPGNYVLRHEIIAAHGANTVGGAQNYPQCFNVAISGSGTAKPEGTLGTALYTSNDPGIHFNPYATIKDYKIPGPALFTG